MSQGANESLEETTAGNYLVSNYPPYSFWNQDLVSQAHEALGRPPRPGTPLGIYVHIPFCRKRCHFCYFKVYTGKDSSEIDRYLDAVVRELTLYSGKTFIGGRKPTFLYFGGGTPSYISTRQLSHLVDAMKRLLPWDEAEEIAFECEPGTITEGKLEILKAMGVTRLSLGIENFDEQILQANGRAHGAKEIDASYKFARAIGFPQINIDLIAGMVGETEENWRECVSKTIALSPDSVTVYQMEIPFNTTISKEMRVLGQGVAPVANWPTKRRWVDYAFSEMEKAGYTIASAYTAVKDPTRTRFLYRDLLWTGADMIGLGVASFSHVNGTHFQNEHDWDPYIDRVHQGVLPIYRALTPTEEERMIREFILQMKLGHVHGEYFQRKFGVDVRQRFAASLDHLEGKGLLRMDAENLLLNRDGLLQVDRLLGGGVHSRSDRSHQSRTGRAGRHRRAGADQPGTYGVPILRYRTGDTVRRAQDARCPCGSEEMALEGGILGRGDDMVVVRGVNLYPSAVEQVVRSSGGVAEFRVEIYNERSLTEMSIQIEPGAGEDGAALSHRVAAALHYAFGLRVAVSSVPAGTLPRFEGKSKRWIYR